MADWQPRDGYVFIITYGRSGSTLLQTVLQSIDGYFIRGENNNVLGSLYQAYQQVHSTRLEQGNKEIPPHGPWYGADKLDPDRFAEKLVRLFQEEVLQPPEDARVVGFKEIRFNKGSAEEFVGLLDFISERFKPSKFIFNMRRWERVAQSGWWKQHRQDAVRRTVEKSDRQFLSYAEDHPERCHVMRYEDYAGKPEAFAALFDFLGEPFDLEAVRAVTMRRLKH
jgi:hypothetical protein